MQGAGSVPPPHWPMGTQVTKGPRHLCDPSSILHTVTASPQEHRHLSLLCPIPTPRTGRGRKAQLTHTLFIVPNCDKGAVPSMFPGMRGRHQGGG